MSLNCDLKEARQETITNVQEVVKGNIWYITVEKRNTSRKLDKLYILEITCEVIGSSVSLDKIFPL